MSLTLKGIPRETSRGNNPNSHWVQDGWKVVPQFKYPLMSNTKRHGQQN